ncbi:trigger factor [Sporolituus thermophilus]|uniref:Trigger factor n=1 Tax=Sporolituus thermophilus DSM 23256 TaxID=1123285 RepID=A0A1G7J3Z9_9FIRM|nr:trigger factor [Sporolituus thermophilus]SDF19615.1 trigger factor [Sporolituus thermophilus DSM 23256]
MKVTAERIDNHKLVLEMEVPQEEVAKAFQKAYQKLAARVNIPGFRKGKAPRNILELHVGKDVLKDEAFDLLANKAYWQALDEQKAEPVTRPEIEILTFEEGKPLRFKATVVTKPDVTLGEYKGLKVAKLVAEVTAEDVQKQLENLRIRHAKMVVVEDAVLQKGDFAIIDFEGFIDGKPFKGGDAKGYPLEVGSGSFIPGFEDQLLGAKAGEEREVNVVFPEDYFVPELAGKASTFKVKIHDIKRKELPELDDDFAKDVSEFDTLEELKADIENKLKEAAAERAEREFRSQAIKLAVDNATVDIPEVMIEQRIDDMVSDLDINLQNRGMKLDDYLKATKMDMAGLRQNYREAAAYSVKTDLVLEAIAKAEGIEVSDEDMQAEVVAMARSYGASVEDVAKIIREQGRVNALYETVKRKKAAKLIVDSAVAE